MDKNPWDQADYPARGDKSYDTVFAAIGRALTEWELLEESLSWIFATLVSGRTGSPSMAAIHAYGTIVAFKGRSEMIEAAARTYEAQNKGAKAVAPLFKLLTEAGKFSARRNEIAHGIVQPFYTREALETLELNLEAELEPDGFVLMPSSYNTKKNPLALIDVENWDGPYVYRKPSYGYASLAIGLYVHEFRKLRKRALDSWWAIHNEMWRRQRRASP